MRIGIDIKCLRTNNSGIGRYTRSLLDALQQVDIRNEYVLFSPSPVDYTITNPKWKTVVVPTKLPGILWQQLALPLALKDEHIDVIWGPEQTIPVIGLSKGYKATGKDHKEISSSTEIASVLTIHDFVYRRFPGTMRKSVLWITRTFGGKSIKKATAIVPVSDFTKNELFHFYPKVNKDKVEVVSCAVDSAQNLSDGQTLNNAARKDQLLFVGSLEPRKNLQTLVRALEILKSRGMDVPLVMTGPRGWKNQTIKDMLRTSSVAANIEHKGFVSDEELRNLYKESAAVIFPSVYEGFGLPALEALAYGAPVLTSKGTVMESVLGDCGLYFDPKSAEDMANVIEGFWKERKVVPEASRVALLSKYSWQNSARKLIEVFQKARHG